MRRYREAALALEDGLRFDPFYLPMRLALDAATAGILRDLVEGVALAVRCPLVMQHAVIAWARAPLYCRAALYLIVFNI